MKRHLLDDPFKIQKLDPQNMLGHVEAAPEQCRDARKKALSKKLKGGTSKIEALLVSGVGGSAMGGDILAIYLRNRLKIPVIVNRDYDLPAWVNRKTLVVCSSYSGDTEEALSAFKQAVSRKLNIVVITSGGALLKQALEKGLPCYEMPPGVQPRAMMYYSFITLLTALENLKLLPPMAREIETIASSLEKLTLKYKATHSAKNNPAKQLAEFLHGKNPVIYASESSFSASAYRWKCQFNENSKQMAHVNLIPEMNHNEILAYSDNDFFVKKAGIILLRSKKHDNDRIQKRFDIFKKIVGSKTKNIREVWAEGDSLLSQMLLTIYLGDFVSVYLAFLKGLNPTSIGLIDRLKVDLKK